MLQLPVHLTTEAIDVESIADVVELIATVDSIAVFVVVFLN
jgi:hypothetical protein